MIRRPPRSTLDRSSAASDVYKRQVSDLAAAGVSGKIVVLDRGEITFAEKVRNAQAAGRFDLIRKNKRYTVVGPRVVPSDSPDIVKGARLPARISDYVLNGTLLEQ